MAIAYIKRNLKTNMGLAGSLLSIAGILLLQYTPPTDPPPGRQTSFIGSPQEVATVQPMSALLNS